MKHIIQALLFFLLLPFLSYSQMWNGQDTLYGNEWINFEQTYFKIKVNKDGIYRISYETLQNNGIPVGDLEGQQFQLFKLGEEVPVYVTNNGSWGPGDYIEFYGEQNRSQLDRFLFKDPDNDLLNPLYSLFNTEMTYYLTWVEAGSPVLRFETVENNLNMMQPKEEYYCHQLLWNGR